MSSKRHEKLLDPHETFSALCTAVGLDVRLRKAVSRLGYVRPTLVQSKSLPLAITSGKDLLVRARTGSGKTLAYCLPVLHKILESKRAGDERGGKGLESKVCRDADDGGEDQGHVRAVILVPTRELCTQVHKTLVSLTYYCREVVTVAVLSSGGSGGGSGKKGDIAAAQQEAMLRDRPDVIVSTPAGLLHHLQSGTLKNLKYSVESLVVDEADLILSFGYSSDVTEIMKSLPKIFQGYLMSATLSPEIHSLKRVILHSPAVLKLEEEDEVMGNSKVKEKSLTQFYLTLPKLDKKLVLYVFLKLGLLKGKGLFFVNTTDGGYRLKLFFEQFHIRSAVLNAELPLRSRLNIIEQFNIGNFDYLIATDESTDVSNASNDIGKGGSEDGDKKKYHKKRKRGNKKDSEYGVSRGLDFRGVSFVVNVDFPPNAKSYTHRVGRTARGGASGVALSLVEAESPDQLEALQKAQESQQPIPYGSIGVGGGGPSNGELQTVCTEEMLAADDEGSGNKTESVGSSHPLGYQPQPCPLDFDLNEIEGFRYRVEDVSRAVTKVAVRETRAAELRAEILNSDRLSSHFEENPSDLQLLQHDRQATHVSKVQDHLKNVPKYMLPRGMQVAESRKRRKRRAKKNRDSGATRSIDNDPLQSYNGGDVTLDGVAGGDGCNDFDSGTADAGFFDYTGDEGTEGIDNDKAKSKRGMESKVFMNTMDDTGKSTSGRNAWKEKRSKGKFSRKYKKMQHDKF